MDLTIDVVYRFFAALYDAPSRLTEVDGKDPTQPCRTQRPSTVMVDDSQFLFADDGNWFGVML